MTRVLFADEQRFELARQFLTVPARSIFRAHDLSAELGLEIGHPVFARLLQRLSNGESIVLPFITPENKPQSWIVAAATERHLERTLTRVSRFVLPTYGEFRDGDSKAAHLKSFKLDGNPFQQLAATLYPAGYYTWQSPAQYLDIILRRLDIWMQLEERQPIVAARHVSSYPELRATFDVALAARNWPDAEAALAEIVRFNLTTADNLAFLQVQLLAEQERWQAIWDLENFSDLAKLRMPRSVRAALLIAFHHSILLPSEQQQDWAGALEAFKQTRPRLGLLLTGRLGLSQPQVILVFAYLAAVEGDRAALDTLASLTDETDTRRVLDALRGRLPAATPLESVLLPDAWQAVRIALAKADYDGAVIAATQLTEPAGRAGLLMEIAFHSGDSKLVEDGLLAYWDLARTDQVALEQRDPHVKYYLAFLESCAHPAPVARKLDWLAWWDQAITDPTAVDLASQLDQLRAGDEESYWTAQYAQQLAEKLLAVITDQYLLGNSVVRSALDALRQSFLRDPLFPREGAEYNGLYEMFFQAMLARPNINQNNTMMLLRLVDALLAERPLKSSECWQEVRRWFERPIAALEGTVLEALEKFIDYDLPGIDMVDLYRNWVSYLLALPTGRDRLNLESWLVLGEWLQPGEDLLARLRKAVAVVAEQDVDDPVAQLPLGFRIGIFTLGESAARRASALLQRRNHSLDIRICLEKDLNDQAKAIAQNSDLVVIVTTCITHALTYGIDPWLRQQPVYPVSSGFTSIVRAIEEHLARSPSVLR